MSTTTKPALFFDFEDSRASVVARLEAMGADPARFVSVRPSEPLEGKAVRDVERLMAKSPGIVVLDGVAEANGTTRPRPRARYGYRDLRS